MVTEQLRYILKYVPYLMAPASVQKGKPCYLVWLEICT